MRERQKVQERIAANALMAVHVISSLEYLCGPSPLKEDLLVVARELCSTYPLKLDRLAKRNGKALECWFCESWKEIEPHLKNLSRYRPQGYNRRCMVPNAAPFPMADLLALSVDDDPRPFGPWTPFPVGDNPDGESRNGEYRDGLDGWSTGDDPGF
jgi:hypothetical protein